MLSGNVVLHTIFSHDFLTRFSHTVISHSFHTVFTRFFSCRQRSFPRYCKDSTDYNGPPSFCALSGSQTLEHHPVLCFVRESDLGTRFHRISLEYSILWFTSCHNVPVPVPVHRLVSPHSFRVVGSESNANVRLILDRRYLSYYAILGIHISIVVLTLVPPAAKVIFTPSGSRFEERVLFKRGKSAMCSGFPSGL